MYQKFQISILVYQLWGETTFLVPSRKPFSSCFFHPETWDFHVVTHHRSHFLPAVSLLSPLGGPTCFEEVKSSFCQNQVWGSKKCRKLRGKLNITVVFVIISPCAFKGKGCFIHCLSFFYLSLLLQLPCEKVFRYLKPSPKPLVERFGA